MFGPERENLDLFPVPRGLSVGFVIVKYLEPLLLSLKNTIEKATPVKDGVVPSQVDIACKLSSRPFHPYCYHKH